MIKYLKVYRQLLSLSSSSYLSNRLDSVCYFLGKIVRLVGFMVLIKAIFSHTSSLAGYNQYEISVFLLTYYFIDTLAQALFRGIYMFYQDIRTGNFDFLLSKPISPLFVSMNKRTDILDATFLLPILSMLWINIIKLDVAFGAVVYYVLLLFFSIVIVTGIHIISASITMRTDEGENFIWIYRESLSLGRFPQEIFSPALQVIFIYLVPVIMMISFPVKALLGRLDWNWLLVTFIYSLFFIILSLFFWKKSLKYYSSASS